MARSSRGESGLSVALAVVWLRESVSTACCALAAIRWWKGRLVRGVLRDVKRERREHGEVEGRSVDGVVAAAMVAIVSVALRKHQRTKAPDKGLGNRQTQRKGESDSLSKTPHPQLKPNRGAKPCTSQDLNVYIYAYIHVSRYTTQTRKKDRLAIQNFSSLGN